jgi:hypothetical protein
MSMLNPIEASQTRTLPKHLKRLEAESIEIMREVVAEFRSPVMLYSIGKDSSVMLHLGMKAFHPAPLPFPVMHVDTTWKFREMIAFRDETAHRLGLNLIVYINQDGVARGISPFISGSSIHTHVMKTEALKAAPAAMRKKAGLRKGFSRFARKVTPGIHATSGRNYGICSIREFRLAKRFEFSPCRIGRSWISGSTLWWRIFLLCRCTLLKNGRSCTAVEH